MDKRRITEIIADVYKTLTPTKTSVFVKNDDIVSIRVISDVFHGMTFSSRFKMLNDLLQSAQPTFFKEAIFIFEAFTSDEILKLPKDQNSVHENHSQEYKRSASPADLSK